MKYILLYIIALVFSPIIIITALMLAFTTITEGKFRTREGAISYIEKIKADIELQKQDRLKKIVKDCRVFAVYNV